MEKRFTVWVGGSEVNDYYLTKEKADALAFEYEVRGYDDVTIQELKGSVTASSFITWYFSDESDYRDLGRDVANALTNSGYYNMNIKRVFDGCGYIPEHICEVFNEIHEEEYEPNDLIFIDDITHVGKCSKCHESFSGDVDFCNNCGNCVS